MESPGGRYKNYYRFNRNPRKYDYMHEGILNMSMSRALLAKTAVSPALTFVLETVESALVFLFHYADKLKNFKNITKYNR